MKLSLSSFLRNRRSGTVGGMRNVFAGSGKARRRAGSSPLTPSRALEVLETRQLLTGDTLAAATLLTYTPNVETTQTGWIGDSPTTPDVDIFSIDLQAGDVVTFDIDARADGGFSTLDSVLRVFNSSGVEVAVNDDGVDPDTGTSSLDSFIEYTVPTAGRYFVGVSGFSNFTYNPTVAGSGTGTSEGDYTLETLVTRQATTGPDAGPTISTATTVALSPGVTDISGTIGVNSDVDMYQFTVQTGDTFTFDIDAREIGLPGSLDSVLRVFDANGSEVLINDDAADPDSGAFTVDSAIEWSAATGGTYYIGVSSFPNLTYSATTASSTGGGSTGDYRLRVTLDRPAPSTDAGDTLNGARGVTLTPGNAFEIRDSIGNNGLGNNDVDIFAVQLQGGDSLIADIDSRELSLSTTLDSVLRVFNSNGVEISVNDDGTDPDSGASGLDSALEVSVSTAGTYYVAVSSFSNFRYNPVQRNSGTGSSQGDYRLLLTLDRPPGLVDAGDTLATAAGALLQPGQTTDLWDSIGNNSFTTNDVDIYSVTLQAGDTLMADIDARETGLSTTLDSVLRVFNASGTEIAVNDDANDPDTGTSSLDSAIEVSVSAAGTYYVAVSSFANFSYSPTQANSGTGGSQGDYRLLLTLDRPVVSSDVGDTLITASSPLVQPGQATELHESIGNNAFGASDVDMFMVFLQGGDTLSADIDAQETGLTTSLDSILRVFDANGVEIAVNDDATDPDTGTYGLDSALEVSVTTPGWYFVGVSSFSNFQYRPAQANSGSGSSQGDYRLVLNIDRPDVATDAGDTIASAAPTLVQPGQSTELRDSIGNNAFGSNDVDVFAVQLQAGDTLAADIDSREIGLSTSLDSILRVFTSSGQELAVNDDSDDPDTGTFSVDSSLEVSVRTAGTYYVAVSSFANFGYSPTQSNSGTGGSQGDYRLVLSLDRPVGTVDAGDTIATAVPTLVQPGQVTDVRDSIGNSSRGAGDVDLFAVQLRAGDTLSADIDAREIALTTTLDSILRVFSSDGTQLTVNDDAVDPDTGMSGLDSSLEFTASMPGTYYVGVSSFANFNYSPTQAGSAAGSSQGDYRLLLTMDRPPAVASTDVGDTIATAASVLTQAGQTTALRESIGNNAFGLNDVDLYALSLQAGQVVSLDIDSQETGLSTTLDAVLRVFNSSGTQLARNDDGADPDSGRRGVDSALEFAAPSTGTFYVAVSSFANFNYSPTQPNSGQGGSQGDYVLNVTPNAASGGMSGGGSTSTDPGATLTTAREVLLADGASVDIRETISNSAAANSDVDLYQITLAAGDSIVADIDSREINLSTGLDSVLRLFDSAGREVAINDDGVDPQTGASSLDSALEFSVRNGGTYYVGVSSFSNLTYNATTGTGASGNSSGDYLLRLERRHVVSTPTPTPAQTNQQVVWLNFEGGSATNGWSYAQGVPAFNVTGTGVAVAQRQALINRIVQFVRDDYVSSGSFENPGTALNLPITITTTRPASGQYMTVFIGGAQAGLLGVAEDVDVGNRVINDNARVFSSTIASAIGSNRSFDQVAFAMADTISHEMGHNLGVSHSREDGRLMQTGALDVERTDNERFGEVETLYHTTGSQNSVRLLQGNLRTISSDSLPGGRASNPITLVDSAGQSLVRSGVLQYTGDTDYYSIRATAGELLRLDVDARQFFGTGVSLTLEVFNPSGGRVAQSVFGVDASGQVGDPFLRLTAPVTGTYSIRVTAAFSRTATSSQAPYVLNVERLAGSVRDSLQTGVGFAPGNKSIFVGPANPSRTFTDANGDLVQIRLTQGTATVVTQLTGQATNRANADRILIRNASANARVEITVTRQGAGDGLSRVSDLLVTSRLDSLTVTGMDIDRLTFQAPVTNVTLTNVVINESISAARTITNFTQSGSRSQINGTAEFRGAVTHLEVNRLSNRGTLLTRGRVEELILNQNFGGVIRAEQRVTTLRLGGGGYGTVDALRDIVSVQVSGNLGRLDSELAELTPTMIRSSQAIGSVNITGRFVGAISAGTSLQNVRIGGAAAVIDGGRRVVRAADATAPVADVVDVTPDPRNSPVGLVTVNFSEAVSGVDRNDFRLTRNNVVVSLAAVPFAQVSATRYTLNLASVTDTTGTYILTVVPTGSGIVDSSGNPMRASAFDFWRTDRIAPTADIVDVTPDPRTTPVGLVTINFSEAVRGVDKADFRLTRNGVVVSLASAAFRQVSASRYTLDLTSVTGAAGGYSLTLVAAGSGIRDFAGNAITRDASESWVLSATAGDTLNSAVASDMAFATDADWLSAI